MMVGVVGSREFKNYSQLETYLTSILRYGDELVSGGAEGVDTFAYRYAREHGFYIQVLFPTVANRPRAYFDRNTEIARRSSILVAFYSKNRFGIGGTADTVKKARSFGKTVKEIAEE